MLIELNATCYKKLQEVSYSDVLNCRGVREVDHFVIFEIYMV